MASYGHIGAKFGQNWAEWTDIKNGGHNRNHRPQKPLYLFSNIFVNLKKFFFFISIRKDCPDSTF